MPAKVLVADDEEKIAKMVGSYLEAAGFEVLLAFDGGRAISLFNSEAPDCLVLDINMPVADGLEVAREARKASAVPILLLTARTEEVDRVVGLELGADDYIVKPFSPRELVARVRAVSGRSSGGSLAGGAWASTTPQDAAPASLKRGGLELDLRKAQRRRRRQIRQSDGDPIRHPQPPHAGAGQGLEPPRDPRARRRRELRGLRADDRRAYQEHPQGDRGRQRESEIHRYHAGRRLSVLGATR